MKSVKDTLLQRRSIRRYERETIPSEVMELIFEAINNTPTSYNGQQFSVIDVSDQELKEKLYDVIGAKQIKTCNRFLAFCSDYNKIALLAEAKGVKMPPFTDTIDGLTVGIVDASLAMMSALTVAESAGLGTCCIGFARTANPQGVAELLGLPKGVFVVCGLALGIPREMPDLKPKQPLSLVVHHNKYRDAHELVDELVEYDRSIQVYNATREGTKSDNDWCSHIVGYYDEAMGYNMLDKLRDLGYDIKS